MAGPVPDTTAQQDDPAGYAAALNDLAQLKLSEGKTQEAQDLFRQALDVQQGLGAAQLEPEEQQHLAEEDEDDWETRWDTSDAAGDIPLPSPSPRPAPQNKTTGGGGAGGSSSSPARRSSAAAAAAPSSSSSSYGGQHLPAAAAGGGGEVPFGGAHILEIHNLTTADKTTQLEQFLARLLPSPEVPPVLKWVDDYRALALFANPRQAQAALAAAPGLPPPAYSVRGWVDASPLSRGTPAAELQAPKPRPVTTAAVARRLIGGALNMKLRDREEERALAAARRGIKAAEATRREKLDEAWGDE